MGSGFQDNFSPGGVRSFYQPGSGFVITQIGSNRTKIDFLVHRDVGGWIPKYLISEAMKNELLHLALQLGNLDGHKLNYETGQPKDFAGLFDSYLSSKIKGLI